MWKVWALMIPIIAGLLASCTPNNLPEGILEFEVPVGRFQVATPDEWVETPELGGYTAVESPDLDLVFSVLSIDPTDEEMSVYLNPRTYDVNGRNITVYNGALGRSPGQYFGIGYYPEQSLHAVVTIGDRRYHVVLILSSTAAWRDNHEEMLIALAASLNPMP